MKPIIYTKEDFTLGELIEETEDLSDSVLVLNSCYYSDYTCENIDEDDFEQILDFYNEGYITMVGYVFNGVLDETMTLGEVRQYAKDNPDMLIKPIERDIEDGYTYSNYDHIVFNDKRVVLC